MPLTNPMPLIAKSIGGTISGKLSKPMAIIPIMAEAIIKVKPIRRLFNKLLNFSMNLSVLLFQILMIVYFVIFYLV